MKPFDLVNFKGYNYAVSDIYAYFFARVLDSEYEDWLIDSDIKFTKCGDTIYFASDEDRTLFLLRWDQCKNNS